MNNLFADIQKVIPRSGTPRRVLYQGPPGSPTETLYEEIGEVAIVVNPPTTAEPSQQIGGSKPGSSGKSAFFTSPAEKFWVCKDRTRAGFGPQVLGLIPQSGPGQDTPRHQTSDREATPDRGKTKVHSATPTFPADYQMQEPAATPPTRSSSARDPRTTSGGQH